VRRHSRSATATILLEKLNGVVKLEVHDAGTGIPKEKLAHMRNQTGELGVGIAGMHERLHQLGGRLEIESSASGTVVRAIWSETNPASQPR
jgi:two-component system NarL family sensor kinase